MKKLNREKVIRMVGGEINNRIGISSSGGSGGGGLAGAATQAWVDANYVSIEFFDRLFQAYSGTGSSATRVNANDTESTIDNIKAMFGFWTEQYLSTLGQGSGGGGGGGAEALSDLLDVELTTLQNGQALVYSSALGKWTNGTAGVNMTQVWSALDSATNEQINVSHLTNALSGYVTTSAISDMATKTWVSQQGYATQTWVGQNFITIAFFDRLFQAYEGTGSSATRVNPNDTTSTIDNIKAMFGFWTEFYLSALGDGSASSGSISLGMLSDVSLSSPTDGQALVYDATLGIWKNGTITSGVSSLSALSDVQLTAPSMNQVMIYDSITGKWENSDLKTVNGQSIIGTGDIPVSGGGGSTMSYIIPFATAQNADTIKTQSLTTNFRFGTTNTGSDTWLNIIDTYKQTTFIDIPWTNANFGAQMFFGINNNQNNVGVRFRHNGSWGGIYKLAYTSDLSNYLPLTGGTMSGNITISNSNPAVIFSANGYNWAIQEYNSNFYFGRGTTYGIVMNTAGHIGIGGEAPSSAYDLVSKGNMYCKGTLYAKAFNAAYVEIPAGQNVIQSIPGYDLHLNYSINKPVILCMGGGNVGIGVGTVLYKLHVNGSIYATGGVTALSDARMKDVKGNLALMVDEIANAPAIEFTWKGERVKEGLQAGTLAQYWQKVLPMVVMDKGGELSMQYGVAALVSSIITARKVVDHERRIAELERENKELKLKLKIA